ncbi:MAG: glycoside hydrolase family 32 protein [Cyclobacteriaceae bacterium]|nr:glycoside hydrolase family 32 protein [Cyclobacteriaceae bacterium]
MHPTFGPTLRLFMLLLLSGSLYFCSPHKPTTEDLAGVSQDSLREQHRPYFHFTPDSMWMNDPNGMVFHDGYYHLFYQYYPGSTVWGPMHWGHAISKDMVSWEHKPIALFPDDHGYIFSGSAVVDKNNTSGFGTNENPPLVAIFTYHDPVGEKQGKIDYQTQGIAYSLDAGESWIKYEKNPVLMNPGIIDFRDPKVRWFEKDNKWIMTLAVKDHIRFYSSPNLKDWKLESEFGKETGAHGGVWECPDLFPLQLDESGEVHWILLVSLNPGGPNGGSGTQYFIGDFDGHQFIPLDTAVRWLDYGPDNYAGVTWSNTGDRTLFMGWMSNWKYATVVPTEIWRSAMTIARELKLVKAPAGLVVSSLPVPEFDHSINTVFEAANLEFSKQLNLSDLAKSTITTFSLDLTMEKPSDFDITLSNDSGEKVTLNFDKSENQFRIDRSQSGNTAFHPEFSRPIMANRYSHNEIMNLRLVVDAASMEVFADDGTTVLTAIYFPQKEFSKIEMTTSDTTTISSLILSKP